VGKRDLVKYINDRRHGIVQEQEVAGVRAKLSFEPSCLLVGQELSTGGKGDTGTFGQLKRKYDNNYYFLLKFSKDNKEIIRQLGSFSRYSEMVHVFSFQMHQFVNLTTIAHDTAELTDYVFEQTYGMSDGNTILLAFAKNKTGNSDEIEINIAECGLRIGNLKFRMKRRDIERVPELDYSKMD
jgi:hypothetical protein